MRAKKIRPARNFDGDLDQWIIAADNLEKSLMKLKPLRDKQRSKANSPMPDNAGLHPE